MNCEAEKEYRSAEWMEESVVRNKINLKVLAEGIPGPIQKQPGRQMGQRESISTRCQSLGKDLAGGTERWLESGQAIAACLTRGPDC